MMENINELIKGLNTVNSNIIAFKYILKTNEYVNRSKTFRRLMIILKYKP